MLVFRLEFWLKPRNRSVELLGIIGALGFAAFLLRDAEGFTRVAIVPVILALGLALALGCLIVFPSANIWKTDGDQAHVETVNDVRNVLISAVVAGFGLVTLFLTYEAAQASQISAKIAADQAVSSSLSDAGSLMGHENKGIRIAGIYALAQLMEDGKITQQQTFRVLTSYIRWESPWFGEASKAWERMRDPDRVAAWSSATIGRGSLKKRAPDVQAALDLLASKSKIQMPNGNSKVDFRADLRDANLQGAALGPGYLENAIFNGAHLDYLDSGVKEGQAHADLRKADFRGASLFHAILSDVNLSGAMFQAPINEDGSPRPGQPTDLRYADLQRANLTETQFVGTNLQDADLKGAVIKKTNFTHAILTGTNLKGVDLRDSIGLELADLRGVISDSTTQWPAGVSVPQESVLKGKNGG
jgi:uncharacterized protein YjbI with pentapeptide repeats